MVRWLRHLIKRWRESKNDSRLVTLWWDSAIDQDILRQYPDQPQRFALYLTLRTAELRLIEHCGEPPGALRLPEPSAPMHLRSFRTASG